ncbi:MAG TPA: response regulator [Nitrospiria bacterium]|nr:response regulator [Nitrospiria bacterium]
MKKRALIVDDSSMMRQLIRTLLEKNGVEVVGAAESGKRAVELYGTLKPDFVTLDMIMPEQSGLQTLKQIRKMNPQAVVIMISSLSAEDSAVVCTEAGASDYILKPFTEEQVLAVLNKTVGLECV